MRDTAILKREKHFSFSFILRSGRREIGALFLCAKQPGQNRRDRSTNAAADNDARPPQIVET